MATAASTLPRASSSKASNSGNARFNNEAQSWDARPFVHAASRLASTAILSRLQSLPSAHHTPQVLDLGCGTGILSFLLAPHVHRIVAVDAAEGMIDVLRQKLQRSDAPRNVLPLAILLEDPEDRALPLCDGNDGDGATRQKFGLITSHLVLHHIPDLRAVLTTMLGCLAPGGRVMLTDFEDFGARAKRFHPAAKMAGVERHGIHAETMAELMRQVGFAEVDVRAAWTMSKKVEKFDGEFGDEGAPGPDQGETAEFPFVLCYGKRPV